MAEAAVSARAAPNRPSRSLRPGRLDLYLIQGLLPPLLITLGVSCVAMMLERALRLVNEMAVAGAHLSYFMPIMGQLLPYYVGLALPAAFMIALIFLVARLDETLELEAMLASGLSLARIAAPLVAFGLVVAAATLVANGILEPHGRYGQRVLKRAAINAGRLAELQPGAFYGPADALTVTLDANDPATGTAHGLFIVQQLGGGRERVLTARSGSVALDGRAREVALRLSDGLHYQDPGGPGSRRAFTLRFDNYELSERLVLDDTAWKRGADHKELTIGELFAEQARDPPNFPRRIVDAELYSRLARSLTAMLLPLLAIPLAFAAKKGRRGLGIVLGGVVLMAFHHGVDFAKNLGFKGNLDPALGIGGLTAAFTLLVLWLFVASRHLPSHSPVISLMRRLQPAFPTLPAAGRARLPKLRGSLIGAYVAWGFVKWTAAAGVIALVLLQMVDIFEHGEDFVERGLGLGDVGRYALLRLPLLVRQTLAMAVLAGAMLAFLRLTRFSEMVAIRAAGVSQFRLLLMTLPFAALLALASAAVAEHVVPRSELKLALWWKSTEPRRPAAAPGERWFRIGSDVVRAQSASPDGRRLNGVAIYRRDGEGLLAERLTAASASAVEDGWTLERVRSVRLVDGGALETQSRRREWRTPLEPSDVPSLFAARPQLSSADARRALEGVAPVNAGPALFETRLHRLAAEPLAPLVMLLLALPLALASSRFGPGWLLLLYPIAAGLAYIVSDGALTVAAQLGMIAPWIGAWTAPLLFGLIGATVAVYSES
jgi:LPS export ABC transporter permease LptG/LPS export ABC transporter permease LptF